MQPAMFYWKERLAIQGTCAPMEHCSISQGKVPVNVCSKERVLHFSKNFFFIIIFFIFFWKERLANQGTCAPFLKEKCQLTVANTF